MGGLDGNTITVTMDVCLPSLLVLDGDELLKEVMDTVSPLFRLQVSTTNYVSLEVANHVLILETNLDWIAISEGGYIGLEPNKVSFIEVLGSTYAWN